MWHRHVMHYIIFVINAVHLLHTLTHTHSVLTAIFPGDPGLAGCPLILFLHLFLDCTSFWDRPKLSMSFLTQSHQVFFGRPLCLIPSTSHVIQRLTQSLLCVCVCVCVCVSWCKSHVLQSDEYEIYF